MAKRVTLVLSDDVRLTTDEIAGIIELCERGMRAAVGADVAVSFERGSITKRTLSMRSEGSARLVGGRRVPESY